MSNETGVQDSGVRTIPAQAVPPVRQDQAITFLADFAAIKGIVKKYTAPKRPNRNKPANKPDARTIAAMEIAFKTPSVAELRELAANNPPPSEYFDGDVERPW